MAILFILNCVRLIFFREMLQGRRILRAYPLPPFISLFLHIALFGKRGALLFKNEAQWGGGGWSQPNPNFLSKQAQTLCIAV